MIGSINDRMNQIQRKRAGSPASSNNYKNKITEIEDGLKLEDSLMSDMHMDSAEL